MQTDDVLIAAKGPVGWITLNRPKALHALNQGMCEVIDGALKAWADDDAINCVVINHAPETRGFCAGGDIRMLADSGAGDGQAAYDFFAAEYRMNARLQAYEKPVIAVLDGVTMGGGVGLSVHGSHRIATEKTLFSMPETGIGLFPDVGGGWFLPRLGGALGMWLALTGARLKGADVAAAGIATQYVESNALPAVMESLADGDLTLLEAMDWDDYGSFAKHTTAMNACFSKDSVEEIFAALAENAGDWALDQLELLKTRSPQTLKVAHRQLSEGAKATDFKEHMRMEYRIARRVVHKHDFLEGVRAVIVDKDNAPKWASETIEDVSESAIDEIFAPLGKEELLFD